MELFRIVGLGAYSRLALNTSLMIAVAVPAILIIEDSIKRCNRSNYDRYSSFGELISDSSFESLTHTSCRLMLWHPLTFMNLIFFFNVTVLFWIISLLQGSTWLIDPYWTFIPPMITAYYKFHPLSNHDIFRSDLSYFLILIWSIRLTHSYFRREEWEVGAREDWRYADMRRQYPRSWWLLSFFAVYLIQQLMLVGLVLPIWSIHFPPNTTTRIHKTDDLPGQITYYDDLFLLDVMVGSVAFVGIVIAGIADTQLYNFIIKNYEREGQKPPLPRILVLETGMWRYSRHPNYFGEQLFWWSIGLFGCLSGRSWTLLGALFNTLVMIQVTRLTENRILSSPNIMKLKSYLQYQRETSVWIPLPPKLDNYDLHLK